MLKNWISNNYLKKQIINRVNRNFTNAKPFRYIVLKDFFDKKKLINVLNSLLKEEFAEKNADLFQFKQTEETSLTKDNVLKDFYNFFSSKEFGEYISKITGLKLDLGKIDMAGFVYQKTDYLLPHDDQLEGRKIAYVINLSNNFKRKDGGRLQFFSSKNDNPYKIIKSFIPNLNNFVLFEVSRHSFHQVEEVMNNKDRVSLTGWFHG